MTCGIIDYSNGESTLMKIYETHWSAVPADLTAHGNGHPPRRGRRRAAVSREPWRSRLTGLLERKPRSIQSLRRSRIRYFQTSLKRRDLDHIYV